MIPKKPLTAPLIRKCFARIDDRIAELKAFDISTIRSSTNARLTALSAAIRDTLDRCFGEGSGAYDRYAVATTLSWSPSMMYGDYPATSDYQEGVQKHIDRSIALLGEARRSLEEDLEDSLHGSDAADEPAKAKANQNSRKVFVVHGHDEAALQSLARFLEKLGLEALILREQPDQGRTIIEKFEHSAADVAFAVVLMTPDDIGSIKQANQPQNRTRQNVLFELGYFVGALGRGKTCLLRKGEPEMPSDLSGVIYTNLDDDDGWKFKLAKELRAAGLPVDMNMVA